MAKIQYPPQGGEKKICLSLCWMALCCVISAVLMIYFTAIIYIPGANVLQSKIEGGKKCTTLLMERGLEGEAQCSVQDPTYGTIQNDTMIIPNSLWWSCNEWCLAKSPNECNHVWASVREIGTEIYWDDCDMDGDEVDDQGVTCNVWENEDELNCKLGHNETGIIPANPARPAAEPEQIIDGGNKETCEKFDNDIISCINGICTNFSNVYSCTFNSTLDDIRKGREKGGDVDPIWDGMGYCLCTKCNQSDADREVSPFPGHCPEVNRHCVKWYPNYPNDKAKKYCEDWVPCSDCEAVCLQRRQCFDMTKRKDPTLIGVNEFGQSVQAFYHCQKGFCTEIYNLKCERKCMAVVNETRHNGIPHEFKNLGNEKKQGKNALIFDGESVVSIRCKSVKTSNGDSIPFDDDEKNVLVVSCSEIEKGNETSPHQMVTKDCINGTWFPKGHFGRTAGYSDLIDELGEMRENKESREPKIHLEAELMIYNRTKLQVNIDGCVNTLSGACEEFFQKYGRDGRNYTARAIYDCFYDPTEEDLEKGNRTNYPTTVIEKSSIFLFKWTRDPITYLMLFSIIPGTILVFSCIWLLVCSRVIDIADDGHMRIKCCGKIVTGIGNVPPYEVPRRKKTEYRNPLMDEVDMNKLE